MPWGKYKGNPIDQVPIDYLQWALQNMDACDQAHARYWPEFTALIEGIIAATPPGSVTIRPRTLSITELCQKLARSKVTLVMEHGKVRSSDPVPPECEEAIKTHQCVLQAVLACTESSAPVRIVGGSARLILAAEIRCMFKAWYMRLSRTHHPDSGGSNAAQTVVNQAYKSLMTDFETWEKGAAG